MVRIRNSGSLFLGIYFFANHERYQMSESRKERSERKERHAEQSRTSQRRRDKQQLAERYEGRPIFPEPEPKGVYRP